MAHPDLTIPAGNSHPRTLQTAIDSGLPGFVDCVLPQAVRGSTGAVTLLDRGTEVLGDIQAGSRGARTGCSSCGRRHGRRRA